MPTIIQIKRGLRENVPTTDNYPGQMFFSTDTMELFTTGTDLKVHKLRDVVVSPTEPTIKVENQLWYDTVTNQLQVYNGSTWSAAFDSRIGQLNNLLTRDKSSIVSAINEVYQMCPCNISFEEFLGKTVMVSFFSGAFSKKAVGAVLSSTTGSSITLTPPDGTTSFKVYTFIPGIAPVSENNNPLLESCTSKMLVPLRQLASVELASGTVIRSLTANPVVGSSPLDVAFQCLVNEPDFVKEYLWDFNGDGVVDLITNSGTASFQYSQPGTYSATCTVLNNSDFTTTSSPVIISVHERSQITSLTATPCTGAAPLRVAFSCVCQNPESISVYQWDFNDGSPSTLTNTGNCQHTFLNPGTYLTKCRVLDKYGSLTTSYPIAIQVIQCYMAQNVHTQIIDPWKTCQIRNTDPLHEE